MKKTGILFIFFLLLIVIFICSDKPIQPSDSEHDYGIYELADGNTQEPDVALAGASNVESRIEQIKSGDFSNLTDLPDNINKYLEQQYINHQDMDWIECNLNKSGLKGLIWQQKDSSPLKIKRIEAIFAVKDNEARLVCSQYGMQGTESYFISKNGNIIYEYSVYGTSDTNYYAHYRFNNDWSKELVSSLIVIRIEDWAIEELKEDGLYEDRVEKYPYWAKAGIYYGKENAEALDESQFLKLFEEMTGYVFYDDNPVKPDWVNR